MIIVFNLTIASSLSSVLFLSFDQYQFGLFPPAIAIMSTQIFVGSVSCACDSSRSALASSRESGRSAVTDVFPLHVLSNLAI